MKPHPFAGFDPLDGSQLLFEVVGYFWPAFLALLLVTAATGLRRWRARLRRPSRFEAWISPPELWALPVLVWALLTSLFTRKLLQFQLELGHPGTAEFFLKFLLFDALFALCLLVLLQVLAVALVDRGRLGLGVRGHARVAMLYAIGAVVLDGFTLLCMWGGRWPTLVE